jgi:hypothetical protein
MVKGSNPSTPANQMRRGKNVNYLQRKVHTKRPSQQKKVQKAQEQQRKFGSYKNMLKTMMNTSKHVIHDKINESKTNESKTKQGGKRKTHKKRKSHKKRRKTHKKRKSHKKHRK